MRNAIFVLLVCLSVGGAAPAAEVADLILHNGKVVTVDDAFTIHTALAVKDGRILRTGSDAEVLRTRSDVTEVIDLGGRVLLPGLIDSHTHPAGASMFEFDHPVPQMDTVADVLAYIGSRVGQSEPDEWIWVQQVFVTRLREQRYPTRQELDRVAPRNPVVFRTGPDAVANSRALELSGIDKDFQTVGPGAIERDPQTGEPTGILRGGTSRYMKGSPQGKPASEADRLNQLQALLRDYNSVGITAIADRNANPAAIDRYQRLRDSGGLTTRVAVSHGVGADGELEAVQQAIRQVAEHPLCQEDPRLRIVGIKMYLDGGMLTGSAYMRQPWGVSDIYSIRDPDYRGVLFIERERLLPIVRTAVESGLQFTAHSVGDGAVHTLLDVYEEIANDMPIRDTRPCITHCNFMSAEAVEKMAALGVVADIQPAWLYLDAHTLQAQFGYDRLRYFQPLKSLFDAGAIAGGGSDHMQKIGSFRSINPYNPFLGIWVTLTRQGKHYDGQLHPEEALTREQAIRFYTRNNAYLLFLEDQVGSLEAGKRADMILIDRDILECPVDDIPPTRVLRTWVDGQLVHQEQG